MKQFIEDILEKHFPCESKKIYDKSPLIKFLDSKMGAINGNSKSRRSLGTIYAIYSIINFYIEEFYNEQEKYKKFKGYEFTKLFYFCRTLYGGSKLQNHALNSRVNGEFENKFTTETKKLIIIDNGKYALHIDFLYVDGVDISKIVNEIIEVYIDILKEKDNSLISDITELFTLTDYNAKKNKIEQLITEKSEARVFEIISYAVLKNHYKNISVYIGYDLENLDKQYLTLYKTGRTNANDGGIDFVMRPLGRFYQVTEVGNYNKFTLDMDKVLHFPITFVIKTNKTSSVIEKELMDYIEEKSGGMEIIKNRYMQSIEEVITINEIKNWLYQLDNNSIDDLLCDIDFYYRIEMQIN